MSLAPPSVVNDLVLVMRIGTGPGGAEGNGTLVVLDNGTGEVAKEVGVQGNTHGGVAVVEGNVVFGTGYFGDLEAEGTFYVLQID